jgi:hypothetical protein
MNYLTRVVSIAEEINHHYWWEVCPSSRRSLTIITNIAIAGLLNFPTRFTIIIFYASHPLVTI